MDLGLIYNLKKEGNSSGAASDDCAEHDSPETILTIKKSLEGFGHRVFLVEADEFCYLKLKKLASKIDFVFNMAEGLKGADREAHVPAFLEMLGIPYSGAGPLGAALTLNKVKTKEVLIANGIPTAPFQLFETGGEKLSSQLKFPLIVKPNREGSSKGIRNDSVVRNKKALYEKINWVIKEYRQPALVEAFLEGEEYSVGIIGNKKSIRILPIIRLNFSAYKTGQVIDSYETKFCYSQPSNLIECPARVSEKLAAKIREIARKTFEATHCYDWARIDIRCDKNNNPYVLEINPFPAIDPDLSLNSGFPHAAKVAGFSYQEMIGEILKAALARYEGGPLKHAGENYASLAVFSKKAPSY